MENTSGIVTYTVTEQPVQRFKLGRLLITPAAIATIEEANALSPITARMLLKRHAFGDWGDLTDDDKEANEIAIRDGERILSRYNLTTEEEGEVGLYIITEWDRSSTTIMRREDY